MFVRLGSCERYQIVLLHFQASQRAFPHAGHASPEAVALAHLIAEEAESVAPQLR